MKIRDIAKLQDEFNSENITYEYRINALKALKASILKNEQVIYEGLKKDLNKQVKEAFLCEINEVLLEIEYHIKHLKKWMKPKKVHTTLETIKTKSYILSKPKGKVLIISPFNYPINLSFLPLVGAISGGNKILLKPSSYTPNTNEAIRKIIKDAFNDEYISYIDPKDIKDYDEIYDYKPNLIFFTGSTKVGKSIEAECVKRNIEYITELGGMCPCVVNDIKHEVIYDRIVWAKFLNAGQTCVSINYIFYNKHIDDFEEHLIDSINKQFPNALKEKNMCKIINLRSFERLINIIDKNKKDIIYGGRYDQKSLFIEPTIIKTKNIKNIIDGDELFGPVLWLYEYDGIDEVKKMIKQINDIDNSPLAAYIMTNERNLIKYFFDTVNAGSYCVNDAITQILNHHLPFGGVYNSGFGKYHGKYSYEAMVWKKGMLINQNKKDFLLKYINNDIGIDKLKKTLNLLKKFKR